MATTYYIDTSALVKRYHVEEGTTFLDEVFSESDATFVIGSITIAELTSAVAQKSRLGEISHETLLRVLAKFAEDVIAELWIVDLERHHIREAQQLILRHNLRT